MAPPVVPSLNVVETASVCSEPDSGIGSCSPTSTGPQTYVPEHKSVQTYRSTEDYLYAMKEDLAEWLNCLYDHDIDVENFFDKLDTGVLLCEHANHVQMLAEEYRDDDDHLEHKLIPQTRDLNKKSSIPDKGPVYRKNVKRQTFQARDNVANFITWCKSLGIPDVVLFETEDLVMRKNDKSVVLAMLEVARRGARFGMLVPCLIQLEQEIDAEIKGEAPPPTPVVEEEQKPMVQKITCDMKSLDEMVRELVSQCTCMPEQFPVIRLAEGKYMVGENKTLIFVRILRNHVMVRVGGGWDTLEHYLNKHDPCRCTAKNPTRRPSVTGSLQPTFSRGAPSRSTSSSQRDLTSSASSSPRSSLTDGQSSCPTTPTQTRRTMIRDGSESPGPHRRISAPDRGGSRPSPGRQTPTNTTTGRQTPTNSATGRQTPTNSTTGRQTPTNSTTGRQTPTNSSSGRQTPTNSIPDARRRLSLDNIPKRDSRSSFDKNSPLSPDGLVSLEGSLSAIRQQSELLQKQLQEDFSDDSLSSVSATSPIPRKGESGTPMSKSCDFSRLRGERRASLPANDVAKRKDSSMTSSTRDVTRRAQTPSHRTSTKPTTDVIARRSMTPQPSTSSRARSTPTTPIMRRRETPRTSQGEPTRSERVRTASSSSGAITSSSLKERLDKYKQETQQNQRQQQQKQRQQQQQRERPRRNSDCVKVEPGLAGSRRKSPSLNSLDRKDLEPDLDAIQDCGGNEQLYNEMEKMFQEFKEQERAKSEQEAARVSVEAELERRISESSDPRQKQESARETLRERLRNRSASTTPTMPRRSSSRSGSTTDLVTRTTPNAPRRSASAAPSWRETPDQVVRRGRSSSSTRRAKTPDPQIFLHKDTVDLDDNKNGYVEPVQQPVKMCRCCTKLSECLLQCKPVVKPRKDNEPGKPRTRIPGPSTDRSIRRASSLMSLASSTDESLCSEESRSTDSEVKSINKHRSQSQEPLSPKSRRSSLPAEGNRIMTPLVTSRSTIMKDAPRAVSPVKALTVFKFDNV